MKRMLICLLFLCSTAFAEPSRDQLTYAYALAYGRLGIGIPEKAPKLYPVTQATIQSITKCSSCKDKAVQVADAVFYDEALNFTNSMDTSILVHELVHYVQWWKYGEAKTCEERLAREKQAYRIQAEVLDRIDVYLSIPALKPCEDILVKR